MKVKRVESNHWLYYNFTIPLCPPLTRGRRIWSNYSFGSPLVKEGLGEIEKKSYNVSVCGVLLFNTESIIERLSAVSGLPKEAVLEKLAEEVQRRNQGGERRRPGVVDLGGQVYEIKIRPPEEV